MDWVRGEEIGHGSFGKVSFAIPRKQSTLFFPRMVVKSSAASCSATLLNEKVILDELKDCPQIINCLGDSFSYENGEKLYNVLLEYASGGALSDIIKNSGNRRLPEFEVKKYTKGLLKGLNYIHNSGYVHCDIKLQNILLGEDGQVKIGDFGLAKRIELNKDDKFRCELRGTPLYMSPEMVTGGEQGTPADVWALGCVVAEMVTGVPVWKCSNNITQLLMTIGVGDQLPEVPEKFSEQGKDFLNKCFVKDPRKRWTAEMLLNHPFVSNQVYDDDVTVTPNDKTCKNGSPSTSPRCPFDFPDWVSDVESTLTSEITSLPRPSAAMSFRSSESWSTMQAAERLRGLVVEHRPESDWSVADGWVSVR